MEMNRMNTTMQGTGGEWGREKKIAFSIAFVVVAWGVYGAYERFGFGLTSSPRTYSMVSMDNSDVYFGKMTRRDKSFVTLDNTFYLRVSPSAQKGAMPDLSVVSIKDGFHKPTDRVELSIAHIVSLQELDPSSSVIKAIENYRSPNAPTPVTASTTTATIAPAQK